MDVTLCSDAAYRVGSHHGFEEEKVNYCKPPGVPNKALILLVVSIFCAKPVNAASPDWALVSEGQNNEGEQFELFIDKSSLRFEKQTVIASMKAEASPKIRIALAKFDCAKSTVEILGGTISEDGKVFVRAEPERPIAVPAGTHIGTVLAFVCDLRPTWRKLLD